MPDSHPRLTLAFTRWLQEQRAQSSSLNAFQRLLKLLWEFSYDSLPSRRQQRYGDVDFDWDHRVDTTSATVGWRDRLLGLLNSPYQPTDPALFQEMLGNLAIDFSEFTFIDIGSGKGRVLLMAADYPFRRVIGVELLPELHRVAQDNVAKYQSDCQRCFAVESICGDASDLVFPNEPLVLYLFNPLPESRLTELLVNLGRSSREHPRQVFLIYHNPLLEHVLTRCDWLRKVGGTHQYAVFVATPS
jgi:SAM-dependent methyltransferase